MNLTGQISILKQEVKDFDKNFRDYEYTITFSFVDILVHPMYQKIQKLLKVIADNNLDKQALVDKFELLFLQFQFFHIVFWRFEDDFENYNYVHREGIYLYEKWQNNQPISPIFQDILQRYILELQKKEFCKNQKKYALKQLYKTDKKKTIMWLSAYFYKDWKMLKTIIETLHENGIGKQITTDDVHNILLSKDNPKLHWYIRHYFLNVFESWDDMLIQGKSPIELHAWLKFAKTLNVSLSDLFLIEKTSTLNEEGEMLSD